MRNLRSLPLLILFLSSQFLGTAAFAGPYQDALGPLSEELVQYSGFRVRRDRKVAFLPFRDGSIRSVCGPLSSLLSGYLRIGMLRTREKWGVPFVVVGDPSVADILVTGEWRLAADGMIDLSVKMGESSYGYFLELTGGTGRFEVASLPRRAQACLQDFTPLDEYMKLDKRKPVRDAPSPYGRRLVTLNKGDEVLAAARITGTGWHVVQLEDDESLPVGLRERRGFVLMGDDATVCQRALDDAAFKAARRTDTVPGYDGYLSTWPSGRHVAEARRLRATALEKRTDPVLEVWTDPVTGMKFVYVPGGIFEMGCGPWTSDCYDDEKPVHRVTLDGFWLGKYEVTQGEWQKVMGSNPSRYKKGDRHPVESVSWTEAQTFIEKLNGMGSAEYSLPSEAQWEYACRSGRKAEKYAGGSNVGTLAWHGESWDRGHHPVGGKHGNGLGLHDMSGNVWEWVQDAKQSYPSSAQRNPICESGANRVLRGGDLNADARNVRCTLRFSSDPGGRGSVLGFRLLRKN